MNASMRIALFAFVLATLAGCGNKGPLVLPPPSTPAAEEAAPPVDADAESPADPAPPADASDDAPIAPPVDEDATPADENDDSGQDGGNG